MWPLYFVNFSPVVEEISVQAPYKGGVVHKLEVRFTIIPGNAARIVEGSGGITQESQPTFDPFPILVHSPA